MKIAVIGGGSTYTPELAGGLLARTDPTASPDVGRPALPLTELCLMDVAPDRLRVVGGLVQRMVAGRGSPFSVRLTADLHEAVRGASYVITQLRVGGMAARREDEYLGRRHGLIGQETTGIGGMAKALRTVPVVLEVARAMRELAPGGLLLNFTNPSGLVTEALARHAPEVPSVGVCNSALTAKMQILQALAQSEHPSSREPADPDRAFLDTLGLNHLTWHRGFTLDGQDLWPSVLEGYLTRLRADPDPEFDPQTVEILGMIPNHYLRYYYYTARHVAEQERWPPSRAEEVMGIEAELLLQYAEPGRREPPAGLLQRGGAYYSTVAARLINAHCNDLGELHVANVRHGGAVAGWPSDWVLELPCRVDARGVHPLPAVPLLHACFGLLAQVKSYELLAVEAAVHGDRRAAYQALLAHPLGPTANRIGAVLDDLLQTNRPYLPQFWHTGRPRRAITPSA